MNATLDIVRNTDIRTIVDTLKAQDAVKHDIVVPASALKAVVHSYIDAEGKERPYVGLTIPGDPNAITATGVGIPDSVGRFTSTALGQLAEQTGIPVTYLRTLMGGVEHHLLAVENVNHWLRRIDKSLLVRAFTTTDNSNPAVVRALLSNRYARFDNLDALLAVLDGIKQTGEKVEVTGADLTEGRLDVRFTFPDVSADISDLVGDYSYGGAHGKDLPFLFAGLHLRNGETGSSAFGLTPQVRVQVCRNGMTQVQDAKVKRHVGGSLDDGIAWSDQTHANNVALITSQTADIIATITKPEYVVMVADRMRAYKGIKVTKPNETIKVLGKSQRWTDERIDSIVSALVGGGDLTVLGVGQAVTGLAHFAPTGEAQADAEESVWAIMDAAAKAVAVVG